MIPFAFLSGITDSWLILSSHFVAGLKVVSNPVPFEQGSIDLTTRQSPPKEQRHSLKKPCTPSACKTEEFKVPADEAGQEARE